MSGITGGVGAKSGVINQQALVYEEGTWTPSISGNSGHSGGGYDAQTGTYVRTGNWVKLHWHLNFSSEPSFSGSYLILQGFPFVTDTGISAALGSGNVFYWENTGASLDYYSLQFDVATAWAYIWSDNGGGTSRLYPSVDHLAADTTLSSTFGYKCL